MADSGKFTLRTLLWGLIIPLIIGFLIAIWGPVIRTSLMNYFGMGSPIPHILSFGFAQMVIFGIPLFLGLVWNKWAGGASGFLMGSLYYLAMAGYSTVAYLSFGQTWNFFADAGLVAYIPVGILTGYIAGALNNKSFSFKRMLGASLTAVIFAGLLQFFINYFYALEPNRNMTLGDPLYAFFLVMLPNIIMGILVPIVARISAGSELSHP